MEGEGKERGDQRGIDSLGKGGAISRHVKSAGGKRHRVQTEARGEDHQGNGPE